MDRQQCAGSRLIAFHSHPRWLWLLTLSGRACIWAAGLALPVAIFYDELGEARALPLIMFLGALVLGGYAANFLASFFVRCDHCKKYLVAPWEPIVNGPGWPETSGDMYFCKHCGQRFLAANSVFADQSPMPADETADRTPNATAGALRQRSPKALPGPAQGDTARLE